MVDFCHYKNIFGEPGTGIHRYRIRGLAIADVLLTVIAALLFSYLTKLEFWKCVLGGFFLGIVAHRLFCVQTTVDKLLFPAAN
jgi:hypothetical protein